MIAASRVELQREDAAPWYRATAIAGSSNEASPAPVNEAAAGGDQ
jgi:hypothetical protein